MYILTFNCGSSSVKYQLYSWSAKEVLAKGGVERVAIGGSFIKHYAKGIQEAEIKHDCPDHKEAISLIINTLLDPKLGALKNISEIKAVGHRVVHGGEKFTKSVIVDSEALKTFKEMSALSPLHNPANITGIEAAQAVLPDIPHCASMDTAWHQTMPQVAYTYALPYEWYEKYAVRRYGFHGTSFLYTAKRAAVLLGKDPFKTNLIIMHVGNGASANAVRQGISVDTSMGMTPLEGLVMGTRSGDHDPAIDFFMMRQEKTSPDQQEAILNKKSGLLGITGRYADLRDVLTAMNQGDKRAELALDIYTYRIRKYIGSYYAALGHVDAIVFTAGVGEMSPIVRQKALGGLDDLGICIDEHKNNLSHTRNTETELTGQGSKVRIFVIPTDEELVMTEDTHALLQGTYDVHTHFTYSFQSPSYVNKDRAAMYAQELAKNPDLASIVPRIPS